MNFGKNKKIPWRVNKHDDLVIDYYLHEARSMII